MSGLLALAAVLTACGGDGTSGHPAEGSAALEGSSAGQGVRPSGDPPPLDLTRWLVPPQKVLLDTFDGSLVPLTAAPPALIEGLRDAIAPIYEPTYERASDSSWLSSVDLVVGYASPGGGAYAYSHRILNAHELVLDTIDGIPILVTFCPLCRSGIIYDRRLGDRTLTFGNTSALYNADLVMFDWETNSFWWQAAGRAIVGALTGAALRVLPSQTLTWGDWRRLHPDTLVLSPPAGARFDYSGDPFAGWVQTLNSGRSRFPIDEAGRDPRLPPAEIVLAVTVGGSPRAYALGRLGDAVVNDVLGGRNIAVFSSAAGGGTGGAYFAEAGGTALTFEQRGDGFIDRETGSVWDLAGRATDGRLAGASLEPAPARSMFWFAYGSAFPGGDVRQ